MNQRLPGPEQTQLTHAADEDGWCRFHLRHFGLHIPAGECAPFQLAARAIRDRRKSQPIRVEFTRPPARSS
jgi:hypothetical protein